METVVFTNGCFDLIHPGHVYLLKKARSLGTKLIVGLNSDRSVRAIKGSSRPFLNQEERAAILREFQSVNEVIIFNENTPERLIREIKPDVLVKGGDWNTDQIVGAQFVLENGGKVFSIPFVNDISSSKIAEKINKSEQPGEDQTDKSTEDQESLIKNSLQKRIDVLKTILNQDVVNVSNCFDLIKSSLDKGKKALILVDDTLRFMNLQFEPSNICDEIELLKNTFDADLKENKPVNGKIPPCFVKTVKEFRQKANEGDILIAVAGNNENNGQIIDIIMQARQANCVTIGLTGVEGKKLASLCEANITVPSTQVFHIREVHLAILHLLYEVISGRK